MVRKKGDKISNKSKFNAINNFCLQLIMLWPLIFLLRLRAAAVIVNYILLTGNYRHIKSSH